jgi:hypothetical protein
MSIASNIGVAENYLADAEVLRYFYNDLDQKCLKGYSLLLCLNYFKSILPDGYQNQ